MDVLRWSGFDGLVRIARRPQRGAWRQARRGPSVPNRLPIHRKRRDSPVFRRRGADFLSWALDAIGFKPGSEHNSPQALIGLQLLFAVIPGLLGLAGALLIRGYRLTAVRHAEIRRQLVEREDQTSAGPLRHGALRRDTSPVSLRETGEEGRGA